MSTKVVYLARVRRALATLDRIARDHPELVGEAGEENRKGWEEAMAREKIGPPLMVRLPEETLARIEAYADRLREQDRGALWNRSDVVRKLVVLGLEQVEGRRSDAYAAAVQAGRGDGR